jgi:Fur family ferric uptake transcriptional regulator
VALVFLLNCNQFAIAKMKAHIHLHSSKRQEMSTLTGRLRRQSRNITGPRQAILEILRKHPHPLTTKEIRAAMPDRCDLATIYRATHLLEQMGMVKRFDFGDGAARFELIGEGDDGHHHHLVCTQCAKVVEIEECALGKIDLRIATANGFAAVTHKLEFFGICPLCRRNGK